MGKSTGTMKIILCGIAFSVWIIIAGIATSLGQETDPENPAGSVLTGVVVNRADSAALAGVHVLNPLRGLGTSTHSDGRFSMRVYPGDEIRFTAIGFESFNLTITDSLASKDEELTIALNEKIYELPTVDVYPYATFSEFKYAFLNFKDPNPPLELNLPEVQPYQEPGSPGEMVRITAPGPISVLYNHFSRREKEKRKYQEVLAQEELARKAKKVINQSVVKNLTGIDTEAEYYAFLNYCNMSNEYIVNTPGYEVYRKLLECYRQYIALKD
ncbi:MAG: carboxypeptidase-like regulatory domain-containing protein [Bacteroidota bacterium]